MLRFPLDRLMSALAIMHKSKELPGVPQLLEGECINMRQVLTDYPDGVFEFKAHYPQHPASS